MKEASVSSDVEGLIVFIRGRRVMLSGDLARLYEVSPKALTQAVKRNRARFPEDFMFQLTLPEAEASRSQFVTLKRGENIKHAPYAFTEQGVAMLSSVLRSPRAVRVNIAIMRAFVRLRGALALHKELACKLKELEGRSSGHDEHIETIFAAIRRLMVPPSAPPRKSGF